MFEIAMHAVCYRKVLEEKWIFIVVEAEWVWNNIDSEFWGKIPSGATFQVGVEISILEQLYWLASKRCYRCSSSNAFLTGIRRPWIELLDLLHNCAINDQNLFSWVNKLGRSSDFGISSSLATSSICYLQLPWTDVFTRETSIPLGFKSFNRKSSRSVKTRYRDCCRSRKQIIAHASFYKRPELH